jgi:hypothetical protein
MEWPENNDDTEKLFEGDENFFSAFSEEANSASSTLISADKKDNPSASTSQDAKTTKQEKSIPPSNEIQKR